jgi:hypothetical protein
MAARKRAARKTEVKPDITPGRRYFAVACDALITAKDTQLQYRKDDTYGGNGYNVDANVFLSEEEAVAAAIDGDNIDDDGAIVYEIIPLARHKRATKTERKELK